MKETMSVFHTASTVLLVIATLYSPWMTVSSDRSFTSRRSSTGYLDPYEFAYAIRKPLPFHSNFGKSSYSVEGASSNVKSTRERAPRVLESKNNEASRDTSNKVRSVESATNTGKWTLDDEALEAWSSILDESTFGDRIVPRETGRQQQTKTLRTQPIQQLIVTSPPINRDEKRNKFNDKEIFNFFAPDFEPKPTTYRPLEIHWKVKKPSTHQTATTTEPTVSDNRFKPKNVNTDYPKSSSKDQDSISSIINSQNNNNQGFKVEHKSADPSSPPSSTTLQSSPPSSSFSYFELGSNFTFDNLGDVPIPFVETELPGKEAGSPGSVSSFIGDLHLKFSPFSLSQDNFGSSDFFTPLTTLETTAERPITSKVREIEAFKSPFSQEIAPFIQSVSSERPAFVPSPPFEEIIDYLPSRYPELKPPSRQLNFPSALPTSTENIAPFSPPKFPEPNGYAGFLPQPLSGPGDSFTRFPKPNFPAFPPPSTKTVYFGGNPNEPPSHLQNNIVNFIKSKAVSEGELKAPHTLTSEFASYPDSFYSSLIPFKTISNAQLGLQKQTNAVPAPPASKVNVHAVRSPPSNLGTALPSPPKTNFPSAATRPNSGFVSSAKQTVSFNNFGTPSSATAPLKHNEINRNPITPKPHSTLLNANKPSRFVASPLLSYTKPIVPASPMPLTRPIRVPQQFSQQVLPPKRSPSGNHQSAPPAGTTSGWTQFNPFRAIRSHLGQSSGSFATKNPTISPQIRQVLPSLTRNPAPVQILAPVPVYLQSGSVTLPQSPAPKTYSIPLEKPVYYHAYVSYG